MKQSSFAKNFSTLKGIIAGITADGVITPEELSMLSQWIDVHKVQFNKPPFKELFHVLETALADSVISDEELQDINYVCDKITAAFSQSDVSDIQELHGITSGIAADKSICSIEWNFLYEWTAKHQNLKGTFPFDEIEALVVKHHRLDHISDEELEAAVLFMADFCGFNDKSKGGVKKTVGSLLSVDPMIEFKDMVFAITGDSKRYKRKEIAGMIVDRGGQFKTDISKAVNYLVVCADGSEDWTFSCYGRKVEAALALRKKGHEISLVAERDLFDVLLN